MSFGRNLKIPALIVFCAASVFVSTPLYGTPVFSFNTGYTASSDIWAVPDVGWAFTSPLTTVISGVQTEFYQTDGRTVTLEFYSGIPNQIGSSLLAQALYIPVGGSLFGPSIGNVSLTAGTTYFVGFKGVQGLGVNYTGSGDPGVTDLALYYDTAPPPYFDKLQTGYSTGRPILSFEGSIPESGVPEPAAVWSTAIGLCGLWLGRRRLLRRG